MDHFLIGRIAMETSAAFVGLEYFTRASTLISCKGGGGGGQGGLPESSIHHTAIK